MIVVMAMVVVKVVEMVVVMVCSDDVAALRLESGEAEGQILVTTGHKSHVTRHTSRVTRHMSHLLCCVRHPTMSSN